MAKGTAREALTKSNFSYNIVRVRSRGGFVFADRIADEVRAALDARYARNRMPRAPYVSVAARPVHAGQAVAQRLPRRVQPDRIRSLMRQ